MMKIFFRTLINIVMVVGLFSPVTIIKAQETNCNYLSGNLLREISPTVVRLTNEVIGEQGSGVIISPDGVIITAAHVVRDADTIQVALLTDTSQVPVNQYIAEVVHIEIIPDFAILRIIGNINNQPVENLSLSSIPISQETLRFGDCATVLGYSLASNSTLIPSDGRISQPIERWLNNDRFHISTITGSFTRGQSGGAVLDSNGILYGIATEFVDNGQFGYIISMGEICLLTPSVCEYVSSRFREDFSQSSPLWDLSTVGQIVDGELIVTTERDNDFVIIPFIANTPVTLSVKARFGGDIFTEDITYITLMYGDIDKDNYLLVKIDPTYIEVYEVTNGFNMFLRAFPIIDPLLDWTTNQSISVTFGETISVYFNDAFLGNSLSAITGTQFALGIEYNGVTGTESVYFDSVEIDLVEE